MDPEFLILYYLAKKHLLKIEDAFLYSGGEREIRTLGTFDSSHDFQSCALDQLSHLSMTIVSITACVYANLL